MEEELSKFSVTASRTHWRIGVLFEKGKTKIVGACAAQLEKLLADPELVVEPLEEETESASPPPPAAPEAGEAQTSAAAPEAGGAQASASASTTAKPKAKTGKPKSKSK